ncbi:hypothetical protein [Barnesiella intestinihominis]|uniref:hypothetical protein n=1 Tax=Barnesiella intestinihominis TaxID=487174 RepID=UPI00242B882C|nr:hypothetical protein [Barnesiella intestinihominis]
MKKIMFNDKYGLTQAVLEGRKTQTRRIMKPQPEDCSAAHRWYKSAYWKDKPMSLVVNEDGSVYCELCGYGAKLEGGSIFRLPYKVGEIVAVAQSYNSFYNDECNLNLFPNGAGWTNKMYVKPELMPYRVRITAVSVERLRDISDVDCLKEGIIKGKVGSEDTHFMDAYYIPTLKKDPFCTPQGAYSYLIDKISGKGTWERNPYVFVYDFELVK